MKFPEEASSPIFYIPNISPVTKVSSTDSAPITSLNFLQMLKQLELYLEYSNYFYWYTEVIMSPTRTISK